MSPVRSRYGPSEPDTGRRHVAIHHGLVSINHRKLAGHDKATSIVVIAWYNDSNRSSAETLFLGRRLARRRLSKDDLAKKIVSEKHAQSQYSTIGGAIR